MALVDEKNQTETIDEVQVFPFHKKNNLDPKKGGSALMEQVQPSQHGCEIPGAQVCSYQRSNPDS